MPVPKLKKWYLLLMVELRNGVAMGGIAPMELLFICSCFFSEKHQGGQDSLDNIRLKDDSEPVWNQWKKLLRWRLV